MDGTDRHSRLKNLLGPEGHEYEHICQVTEAEAEKKLTYSWRYNDVPRDAYVTFELSPQGEQTQLKLTYRITQMFPSDNPNFDIKNAKKGWNWTATPLRNSSKPDTSLASRNRTESKKCE